MRGWIEWFAQGLWKRRRSLLTIVGISVVIVAVGILRNLDLGGRPSRTMNDPTFENAAITICKKETPPLRAVRREKDTEKNLELQTAKQIERVATKLTGV